MLAFQQTSVTGEDIDQLTYILRTREYLCEVSAGRQSYIAFNKPYVPASKYPDEAGPGVVD